MFWKTLCFGSSLKNSIPGGDFGLLTASFQQVTDVRGDVVYRVIEFRLSIFVFLKQGGQVEYLIFLMRIAALVEIIAQFFFQFLRADFFGFVKTVHGQFLTVIPPFFERFEIFRLEKSCFGKSWDIGRRIQTIEPGFPCRMGILKKEDIGRNTGIRSENTGRQTDNGVEIESGQELFLDIELGVVRAKEETVRKDDRRASVFLQTVEDQRHKEIGRFTAGQIVGEVALDVGLFAAAVGRIHHNDIETVFVRIVQDVADEGIVVDDVWHVYIMQEHIGDAEHVGELLLLDAVDRLVVRFGVFDSAFLRKSLQPAGDETAGAAGEIGHLFTEFGTDHVSYEVGDGARSVELTGGTGALQLAEDGFVDLAESVTFLVRTEVELVNDVEHLTQQHSVLHVLVGIRESGFDDGFFDGSIGRDVQPLESGEEGIVDKIQQGVAGQGFAGKIVGGPVGPAALLRDDGPVVVLQGFPVALFGIIDLEKEHPGDLLDTLRVAVDARVVAHDVAQSFDKTR